MIEHYQDGDVLDYTPVSDVAIGVGVVVGSILGITVRSIAANEKGALSIAGVKKMLKTGGAHAFTQGEHVYFDESEQLATDSTDGGANILCGVAAYAATAAATYVYVRLQPQGA